MAAPTSTRGIGEKVSVDHPKYPGVWIIKSLGPVNAQLEPENGGRRLRVPQSMLTDPGSQPTVRTPVFYDPGELVRVTGRYAGLYTVIADKGGDKVNLAKLGGDGGRYLRATRPGLVKVDPAEVLIEAERG
jgi:hypothetical protein